MSHPNTFLDIALSSLPRLLSCLDRNPLSAHYGCFDKNYWHYRIVTDFPSAPFQAGVYSLALAFTHPADNNPYCDRSVIKEYIEAGLRFWAKQQHKDGSFDEWYRFERSHVATAFTSLYISETLLILDDRLDPGTRAIAINALRKSCQWLSKNQDKVVSNHSVGALVALQNFFLLANEEFARASVDAHLTLLEQLQSSEGWFAEYGGADLGYLSLSLEFLTRFYAKTQDPRALKMISQALSFMKYFAHPDQSYGGEYGARNTKYIFPFGLVRAADHLSDAQGLLSALLRSLAKGQAITPLTADDRYATFFFLPSYLDAGFSLEGELLDVPMLKSFEQHFEAAGIFNKKNILYHAVINYKKNGVSKIFSADGRQMFSDTGYVAQFFDGTVAASQWLDPKRSVSVDKENNITRIKIRSPFAYTSFHQDLAFYSFAFKILAGIIGRSAMLSEKLGRLVKHLFIKKIKTCPIILEREMVISEEGLTVRDHIVNRTGKRLSKFFLTSDLSVMHVPSSKLFVLDDLRVEPRKDLAQDFDRQRTVTCEYKHYFNTVKF
ncbi:MAG TPA: hypothetical protein PKO44_02150 [Candidatus Omnitrophota bacterium]|nr:hypothetical protein [Candidatus Omnitrophota bacterium]